MVNHIVSEKLADIHFLPLKKDLTTSPDQINLIGSKLRLYLIQIPSDRSFTDKMLHRPIHDIYDLAPQSQFLEQFIFSKNLRTFIRQLQTSLFQKFKNPPSLMGTQFQPNSQTRFLLNFYLKQRQFFIDGCNVTIDGLGRHSIFLRQGLSCHVVASGDQILQYAKLSCIQINLAPISLYMSHYSPYPPYT